MTFAGKAPLSPDCAAPHEPKRSAGWASSAESDEWLGEYRGVVLDLRERAPTLPGVKSVWLHGSRAVGSHHDASDLDVTFITSSPDESARLVTSLANLYDYQPEFVDYFVLDPIPFWSVSAGEFGVHILNDRDLSAITESLAVSIDGLEQHQAFAQHTIMEGVPLFDPSGHLESCQRKCNSVPAALFAGVAEKYLRLLEQKLTWWTIRPCWKNNFERFSDMAIIVEEIVRCHYALNQRFFMPGMKEFDRDLRILKPDLCRPMNDLIEMSTRVTQNETRQRTAMVVSALRQRFSEHIDDRVTQP